MDLRRILLIHPLGYDARSASRDISRVANLMPPLGLASIAAYLETCGFRADIVDCFAHPDSGRKIEAYVRQHRPQFDMHRGLPMSCSSASAATSKTV